MGVGAIPKSAKVSTSSPPEQTTSNRSNSTSSGTHNGTGSTSTKDAAAAAIDAGTSINVAFCFVTSNVNSASSLRVYSAGPPSSTTFPSYGDGSVAILLITLATSATYVGCTTARPSSTSGTTWRGMFATVANQFNNLSSGPNKAQGRTIVAFGNSSRTACSPLAFARAQATGLSGDCAAQDTWMKCSQPASRAAFAIVRATSTFVSSYE